MKKETHPAYQKVLFVDSASGYRFICGSTLQPSGTEKFEGKDYPVYYLSISSSSHPYFTGSKQLVDSEGRVEKFRKRFEKKVAPVVSPEDGATEQDAKDEKKAALKKPVKAAKKK
jgi:large subunit ribosomal protein L31